MPDESKPFLREHLKKEVAGVFWLAAGIFLLFCLASFDNGDPSFNNNLHPQTVQNFGGVIGSHLADLLLQLFGLPAYLLPFACFLFAWRLLKFREIKVRFHKGTAFFVLLLSLSGLVALRFHAVFFAGQTIKQAGGALGRLMVDILTAWLNVPGATVFLLVFFLVSLMLTARFSMVLFLEGVLERFGLFLEQGRQARKVKKGTKPVRESGVAAAPVIAVSEPKTSAVDRNPKKKKREEAPAQVIFDFLEPEGTYHKPPLSLLEHEGEAPRPVDKESLMMNARILEKKLQDFGVQGEVTEVKPGPVVTMYEFAPAPGVKVNKIAGLSDDLSMALKALSIRIVAPIPGRGVVGIEIPNKERDTVWLKEIFESEEFQKSGGRLPMALGKDIFGRTVVADLAKMPHLLVAGSTGSGKSVSINTMVLSLLYRATPQEVRIIMVDPKMLELSIYEGIPHLLLPVVTNPKKAALALAWAVREMERRYKLMADKGVRNIEGYNKKIAREEKEKEDLRAKGQVIVEPVDGAEADLPEIELAEGEVLEHGHIPYIVVIVDELADLMMVAGREIEESIARLAQMARASGIHLILATQRPLGRCHHRPDQGQLPHPHQLQGLLPHRLAHHPRPDGRRSACSGWETCSFFPPAPAPCSGCTAPSFPNWKCSGSSLFCRSRGSRNTTRRSSRRRPPAKQAAARTRTASTRNGTRRWRSSRKPARRRFPCCSGACASVITVPPASSRRWSRRGSSAPPTAPAGRVRCSSAKCRRADPPMHPLFSLFPVR